MLDLFRFTSSRRRTKIVATVGPASSSPEALSGLVAAGVDVFRLNFSHGTQEQHRTAHEHIRTLARAAGRHIAILADLCGPKIRVGLFEQGSITLTPGEHVTVTSRPVMGGPGLIPSEYPALSSDVKPNDRVLLADGSMELKVLSVDGTEVLCEVVQGGILSNKKGINLPGVAVSTPALTVKDRADAVFAARLGVEFLALSFVRNAEDVEQLRDHLAAYGLSVPIIAKIEKPEALAAIHAIVQVSDGVMVARGDLGVEVSAEEVPLIQQELIRISLQANRPVIVATQMLESMVQSPRPTRAEVTDVAFAALAEADAVMLSAETAVGKFPREAVATMDKVLRLVEGYQWKYGGRCGERPEKSPGHLDLGAALSRAASSLSCHSEVRAVVVPTLSGNTARRVAGFRPAAPVIAVTDDEGLCRRLSLVWGITAVLETVDALRDPARAARETAQRLQLAAPGEHVLLIWDSARGKAGFTPSVSILEV